MFRRAKVVAVAVSIAVGGLGPVPAGAQALRAGVGELGAAHAAPVAEVAYRGGGVRVGGFRGARVGGMRAVGVRPGYRGGAYRAAAFRPGFAPGYRPGFRPGYRPGFGPGYRPGFRPGVPVGWGRPGWRPPVGAWGPGAWRPGWGWYRPGWGWGYYNNTGAWIALGVASAVAIGAAAAAANSTVTDDAVAYCMQRFRSYNPNTGTYTGYDGLQHPCP